MNQQVGSARPVSSPRCALYLRSAVGVHSPDSIQVQEQICRESAASKGWEVLDEHVYRDTGVSGVSNANWRPGLHALLSAAKVSPRAFEYVLVEDTARLSRNVGDTLRILEALKSDGVGVVFVAQDLDSCDPNFDLMFASWDCIFGQYVNHLKEKIQMRRRSATAVQSLR